MLDTSRTNTHTLDPHFSTVALAVDTACLTPSLTFNRNNSRNISSILHIVFSTSFWQVSDDKSLTCLSNSSLALVPTFTSFHTHTHTHISSSALRAIFHLSQMAVDFIHVLVVKENQLEDIDNWCSLYTGQLVLPVTRSTM